MANELQCNHIISGATLYAVVYNAAGQLWNGSTFETLVVANWTTYDIALTETPASSYRYLGTMPAVAAGLYSVAVYEQAGAAPAVSDTLVGTGQIHWSGTAELGMHGVLLSNGTGSGQVVLASGKVSLAGSVYDCRIDYNKDGSSKDEWNVIPLEWDESLGVFKAMLNVSSVAITVTKRSSGVAVISAELMTQVGATGVWKFDASESSQIVAKGDTAIVQVTVTLAGGGTVAFNRAIRSRDKN